MWTFSWSPPRGGAIVARALHRAPLTPRKEPGETMRLGMFMMPLHPAQRAQSQTLQEDREAVILADRLVFHDVFVGEHLTAISENVTNSFIFLSTLIHDMTYIK